MTPIAEAPLVPRLLHRAAINIGRHALGTRGIGFPMMARAEFWVAYRLECDAASLLPPGSSSANAVLCRSAAILAYHAGAKEEASRLAGIGLQSWMPEEIAESLRQIQRCSEPSEPAEIPVPLPTLVGSGADNRR